MLLGAMRSHLAISIAIVLLAACNNGQPDVTVEIGDDVSMPDCPRLDGATETELQSRVANFFLKEVGVEAKRIRINRGAHCADRAVFAIFVFDEDHPKPFFVDSDLDGNEMRLLR